MLTLEQNIRAVIETCFSESREDLQEIATQRIIELIETNASNALGTHWISCEDRLPDKEGDYLVSCCVCGYAYVGISRYLICDDGNTFWELPNVLAWINLPEVYKEK